MSEDLWPVVIVAARYGGVYEGAEWFALKEETVPPHALGSDGECWTFFGTFGSREAYSGPIGRGTTPDQALVSLRAALEGKDERRTEIVVDLEGQELKLGEKE